MNKIAESVNLRVNLNEFNELKEFLSKKFVLFRPYESHCKLPERYCISAFRR